MKNIDSHKEKDLEGFSQGHPFTVPENYFGDLEKNILANINSAGKKKGSIIRFSPYFRGAVAALLIISFGILLVIRTSKLTNNQLSDQEIIEYFNTQNSEDLVLEAYAESVPDQSINSKDSLLEDYILLHADESLIIEEL